jgi:dienelactone hydrolase
MIFLIGVIVSIGLESHAENSIQLRFYTVPGGKAVETNARYPGDLNKIRAEGLAPHTSYKLNATFCYASDLFQSSVDLDSDASGVIDTGEAKPTRGSYTKADADGIFWSMKASGSCPTNSSSAYQFTIEKSGQVLGTGTLQLAFLHPAVTSISLKGTGLVGVLYIPATAGPHPAVITLGGAEGGIKVASMNAAWLANQGYVALGLGYFGVEGLPSELANIQLEYFEKAIHLLQSRPEVIKEKIAVMGMSRGGELALLLGATFHDLKAVVAQVPSSIQWAANALPNIFGQWPPAWIYHSVAQDFLSPLTIAQAIFLPDGRWAYNLRPIYETSVQFQADRIASATTAVEQTNGPIFMFGGSDDQVWPSCDFVNLALSRLKAKKHAYHDEAVCYKGAGHSVGVLVGAATTEPASQQGLYLLNFGGNPEHIAAGQRDAANRTLDFLRTNL